MTRNNHRAPLHCKRRNQARSFPYVRFATVMPSSGRASDMPCLRLQGEWLNEAGFFTHWRVKVTVVGGKLVIEPLVDALGLFSEFGFTRNSTLRGRR